MGRRVVTGNGGWVLYSSSDLPPVFVRFKLIGTRFAPVDLFVENDEGITPELLRRIPLGRIEASVNSGRMAEALRASINDPAPDLRTAARYFQTEVWDGSMDDWASMMLVSQEPGKERYRPKSPLPIDWVPKDEPVIDVKLAVPERRPYPDDFYRAVADRYWRLVIAEENPAPRIAAANGVPVTTVHRWVRETRKRGFLPPAQPGKAS